MKQQFLIKNHEKFKKYFGIKKSAGKWDNLYIKKTKQYIKLISWIPGLKMIGIGNSVSMNYSTEKSDIDLFIVTSENTMWLNRILITIIFQLFGIRKTRTKHSGRFCLSFFATTSGLNFGNFALKEDIYLYFWILYFKPILNRDNTYELLLKENEKWANFSMHQKILKESIKYIKYTGKSWGDNFKYIKSLNQKIKKLFIKKTIKNYISI